VKVLSIRLSCLLRVCKKHLHTPKLREPAILHHLASSGLRASQHTPLCKKHLHTPKLKKPAILHHLASSGLRASQHTPICNTCSWTTSRHASPVLWPRSWCRVCCPPHPLQCSNSSSSSSSSSSPCTGVGVMRVWLG